MKKHLILYLIGVIITVGCKSSQTGDQASKSEIKRFKEENFDPFFKGTGTEPFWNISIDRNFMVYTNADGMKEIFPVSDLSGSGNDPYIFTSQNGTYDVRLSLVKGNCSDGMSDRTYDYRAELSLTGKGAAIQQKGCGSYIVSKELQGKWELSFFKGEEIPANKFLKTPYLEFEHEERRVSGNASCNGFNGTVSLDNKAMRFSKFGVTRMMCVHENMEQVFLDELAKVTAYEMDGNVLNLYNGHVLSMKFIKK